LAASIFIIYLFILWQTKCQNPLMELKIFKNPGFSYANIAVFIIFMILAGVDFIVPFFLQMTKGLNPYQVGLFMFLYSALYSVFSPWAGKLLDKPAFRFLSITSLLVAALLFFGYALTFQHPSLIITFFFFTLWGITNSFLINENMRLVLVNTPSDEQGIGSGIINIANNLSMVFGVCFFQIIFSHLPNSPVAFRSVFLFAGLLYLFTAVFSRLSEKASGLKSKA
jgi:predicted MFS family arabinose efflux permease